MLILDIDNTILPSKEAYNYSLNRLSIFWNQEGLGSIDSFFEMFNLARQQIKHNLEGHSSNRLRILYFKKMMEAKFGFLTQSSLSLTIKLENEYFFNFQEYLKTYYKQNISNYNKVFSLLDEIHSKRGFIFLSNENLRTQIIKLQAIFPQEFKFQILVSEELGIEKPAAQIFLEACRKLKAYPESCVMIGDNHEDDIEGASKLGISTIHLIEMFGAMDIKANPKMNLKNSFTANNLISALEYYMEMKPE